ncbi:VWA-like domain-containing protein [Brachybacterium sp. ACRRE]|uniref:vWA domain-containing protein n=1 Tax=Brachybacterium sp. ACRRE TaxID=2918184 RepID=UPI001EF2C0E6|nr:VWA-like domain-containing protein [Brachybacterium sp. ACRRE]MCG7308312.1 VWA-like domain-containing protein [Brachybacterium sp. ACRRE]
MSGYARRLTTEQEDRLSVWRALAEKAAPYTAALLYAARYVNAPGLGTLGAVDPRLRVFLDVDAMIEKWTDEESAQVLVHLMFHVMFDHHSLAEQKLQSDGDLSPDLWRMAADAAVNDDLEDAGITFPSTVSTTAEQIGMDRGLSAPEYYDELSRRAHDADMDLFHLHEMASDLMGGAITLGTDLQDRVSLDFLTSTWEDLDLIAPPAEDFEIVAAVHTVAEEITKAKGAGPGRLGRWAEKITAPSVIPWQIVVGGYLRKAARRKPRGLLKTYSRASRRQAVRVRMPDGSRGRKIILPGTVRPVPTLVVIRDTSGSVSDRELGEMSREIEEIAVQCGVPEDRVFVLDVDDAVYRARSLSEKGVLRSATGGGGTDMRLGLAAIPEVFTEAPELVVVATDGGTSWPETPTAFPVVALVTSDGKDTTPAWIHSVSVHGVPA